MTRRATVAASAVLVSSAVGARRRVVSDLEERVFRFVNERFDEPEIPARTVMQAGSLPAVYVAAAVVDAPPDGRSRAAVVAGVGTVVWLAVKAVKRGIGRGRPDRHLPHVVIRGRPSTGLGYPSGHAAVATTLAIVATDVGPMRVIAMAIAGATGIARVHVGAHLPLDVVGGHAIGLIAASTARRFLPDGR